MSIHCLITRLLWVRLVWSRSAGAVQVIDGSQVEGLPKTKLRRGNGIQRLEISKRETHAFLELSLFIKNLLLQVTFAFFKN